MAAVLGVVALLALALVPAYHHHHASTGGLAPAADQADAGAPTGPAPDDDESCPLCQALDALGPAILLAALPVLLSLCVAGRARFFPPRCRIPGRDGTTRPRQRAPPVLI